MNMEMTQTNIILPKMSSSTVGSVKSVNLIFLAYVLIQVDHKLCKNVRYNNPMLKKYVLCNGKNIF